MPVLTVAFSQNSIVQSDAQSISSIVADRHALPPGKSQLLEPYLAAPRATPPFIVIALGAVDESTKGDASIFSRRAETNALTKSGPQPEASVG